KKEDLLYVKDYYLAVFTTEKPENKTEGGLANLHRQGNLYAYFNKLKKCWDELYNLNGVLVCPFGKMQECSCNMVEKFLEIEGRSKLVQFLMKLNDDYELVRNQILVMDSLPNVNKAYYIVQQVEKKKQVRNGKRELKQEVKGFRHCTNYGQDGHSVEHCFENIGYPDSYKGKKNKRTRKMAAHVNFRPEIPFDMGLGHLSLSKMIHVDDCKKFNVYDLACDICMLAKFHRLPFPKSLPISHVPFELIHVDLWGPYKAPALNGAHYFYAIVDDKSIAT
nr:hypothetical protein [Tanacetum cinerariifolium]